MALSRIFPAVALAGVLTSAQASLAAEGGFSFYLPGTAGDVALAQSSEPGLQVANTVFFQSGDAGAAVLQGNLFYVQRSGTRATGRHRGSIATGSSSLHRGVFFDGLSILLRRPVNSDSY